MTCPRVVYRKTGSYDAVSDVAIESDGTFRAEDGGYVTRGPRSGRLSPAECDELARLVAALGDPGPYGMRGVDGFSSELVIDGRPYSWWNEAPTPGLAALARFLSAR